MSEEKKFCFVVSPIGEPDSLDRKRANGILREIIQPALKEEYEVERADHDKSPGIVTEGIIIKLIDADLVVADLSGHNPNVMYEVAIRHAANKPVIQIIEEGEEIPFDIRDLNTIYFNPTLDGLSKAIADLKAAVLAVDENKSAGNPVFRAIQLYELAANSPPDTQLLIQMVQELSSEVRQIQSRLPGERGPQAITRDLTVKDRRILSHNVVELLKT